MARIFIIAVLLIPFVEIAVMIKIGQTIGLWPTLGLLAAAAVLGAALLRVQGLAILMQMRGSVEAGRLPARTIADAMMIGLAAMLLVLPGFLSDIVALALLLPPVRTLIYQALAARVTVVETTGTGRAGDPRVRGPGTIDLDNNDYRRE